MKGIFIDDELNNGDFDLNDNFLDYCEFLNFDFVPLNILVQRLYLQLFIDDHYFKYKKI